MTQVATTTELLIVAIQDLYAGECVWRDHLPNMSDRFPHALLRFVAAELARCETQLKRLETLASQLGAPASAMANIWLSAILEDAERDSRTITDGSLRAIALVGAFRKGKQAERVSYETAIGLAEVLELDRAVTTLSKSRDEEARADLSLADLLSDLFEQLPAKHG